jgi:hypothetical protein
MISHIRTGDINPRLLAAKKEKKKKKKKAKQ